MTFGSLTSSFFIKREFTILEVTLAFEKSATTHLVLLHQTNAMSFLQCPSHCPPFPPPSTHYFILKRPFFCAASYFVMGGAPLLAVGVRFTLFIDIFFEIILARYAFATSKIYFQLNYANLLSHHYKKLG